MFTQNSKQSKAVADQVVGYCYLDVDDSKTWTLADGVDDDGDPVSLPSSASGAIIRVEHTSDAPELRIAVNGSDPDIGDKRGYPVYEDGAELLVGKTMNHFADFSEVTNFKAITDTGKTVRLHITFVLYNA